MKKIAVFILLALCSFPALFGCFRRSTVPDDNEKGAAGELYALYMIDGEYYIRLSPETTEQTALALQIASISFDSVDAMLDAIRNNRFEEWQYNKMRSSFPKDENGIKVFDIDHAVDPAMPDDLHVASVEWVGQSYSIELVSNADNQKYAVLQVLWPDEYELHFVKEYETRLDQTQLTITDKQNIEDRGAEVIYYESAVATLKSVRYTLPNGVIVEERYVLTSERGTKTSDTVPSMINLYSGTTIPCFAVTIAGLEERPNVEWLSQFGVKERVGK